jgi:hypothetical protein
MRSRWPLLAILGLLASLLVPGIASASTTYGPETRVWAFELAGQVHVGVERSPTLEPHPECEPTYDRLASDSLLAARGGRVSKVKPVEGAGPHTGFKRDPQNGKVTGYTESARGKPGTYRPHRTLPRDEHGNPVPDTDARHTQLGQRTSKRTGETYTQAREFDADGRPVRDVDFTTHGRRDHVNPHQHRYDPKTGRRLGAEPLP